MKDLLSITKAAQYLGVSAQTLRRWDNKGTFKATFVSPGGLRLYSISDLEKLSKGLFQIAKEWVSSNKPNQPEDDFYCQTSDRFKTRLDRFALEIAKNPKLTTFAPLVSSVTGEIGNNSFDHNIGNWPDIPGIFFAYDLGKRIVVLADRGRGVLTTLKAVRPNLNSDAQALNVAFTEVVTGRAPENRGNGLKYVKKAVNKGEFDLAFQSGNSELVIKGDGEPFIYEAGAPVQGCLVLLEF